MIVYGHSQSERTPVASRPPNREELSIQFLTLIHFQFESDNKFIFKVKWIV